MSTSGYRHHFSEKMTNQRANQIKLIAEMKVIHHDLKLKSYGSSRVTVELQSRGFDCSENYGSQANAVERISCQRSQNLQAT